MFRLLARTLFAFVFWMPYLPVASPTARALAAMRAKVVPHMARGLGGAAAFQFALQELGNNEEEEEESHDDDEKSCGVSDVSYIIPGTATGVLVILYYWSVRLP